MLVKCPNMPLPSQICWLYFYKMNLNTILPIQVLGMAVSSHGMMLKSVAASGQRSNSLLNPEFAEYYDYEEPLPQGPTRPPVRLGNQQKQIQFPGGVNLT